MITHDYMLLLSGAWETPTIRCSKSLPRSSTSSHFVVNHCAVNGRFGQCHHPVLRVVVSMSVSIYLDPHHPHHPTPGPCRCGRFWNHRPSSGYFVHEHDVFAGKPPKSSAGAVGILGFVQSLSTTASSKLLWLSSPLVPVTQTCTNLVLKSASHFPELFHG